MVNTSPSRKWKRVVIGAGTGLLIGFLIETVATWPPDRWEPWPFYGPIVAGTLTALLATSAGNCRVPQLVAYGIVGALSGVVCGLFFGRLIYPESALTASERLMPVKMRPDHQLDGCIYGAMIGGSFGLLIGIVASLITSRCNSTGPGPCSDLTNLDLPGVE